MSKARILSREHNLPVISINHLEGHAFAARLKENDRVPFPFVFLLLSGGHSQILLCKGISDFYHLGGTLDDSLGEAYDKVARLLGSEFAHGKCSQLILTNIRFLFRTNGTERESQKISTSSTHEEVQELRLFLRRTKECRCAIDSGDS